MSLEAANLWSGEFGDAYLERNSGPQAQAASLRLMADALRGQSVSSVLEVGANIGLNLRSLGLLFPSASLNAIEINSRACEVLTSLGIETTQGSLLEVAVEDRYDLVVTCGVLIHIPPVDLVRAYGQIYAAANRLILIAEYYSPFPTEVLYRGKADALWKRDFAGDMLDAYPDLHIVDAGFTYHRRAEGMDDINWFLLEKRRRRDSLDSAPA